MLTETLAHIERAFFSEGKPTTSMIDLLNGSYKTAGELIVMSLLQGGPAPCFFDTSVYNFLSKQDLSTASLTGEAKEFVTKVTGVDLFLFLIS